MALVTAYSYRPNEAHSRNATLSALKTMTIEEDKTKNEAAIRELISGFVKAIRAKDINGVMSVFAPELSTSVRRCNMAAATSLGNAGKSFSTHIRVLLTSRVAI